MRTAVLISAALIALASGCGGDDDDGGAPSQPEQPSSAAPSPAAQSPEARRVAASLPAAVKEIDGGILTNVSCEPRPTQLEKTRQWECRGTVDGYGDGPQATVLSVQATPDGRVTTYTVDQ